MLHQVCYNAQGRRKMGRVCRLREVEGPSLQVYKNRKKCRRVCNIQENCRGEERDHQRDFAHILKTLPYNARKFVAINSGGTVPSNYKPPIVRAAVPKQRTVLYNKTQGLFEISSREQ